MTKLEVLKSMLEDPELMEKYEITEDKISKLNLTPYDSNNMIAVIQNMVNIVGSGNLTPNTAAANLNSFLETRLIEKL